MIISNAKIYYQINGGWVEIEPEYLIFLDISEIQATGRAPDSKQGIFVNRTYDSVDFKIWRGHYRELDSLYAKDSMYLRIDDGVAITTGKFVVTEKITIGNTSEIEWDIDDTVPIIRTPKAAGVISGVQDVYVNGTSVVDPDTGIAEVNLVPYAKQDYVEEIAEEAKEEIIKLNTAVNTKQNKLTAGENIKIENDVISATGSGTSTTAQLRVVEPARESLGGESTIQQAINIENVNAIKELVQTIDDEATRATSEEGRLDGMIDALDATKADQEAVTAGLAKKQDILSSKNAGTNITITEEGGIVKINSVGGSGGVSQDYVDEQDQAILATATERIKEESVERANMDATLTEGLLQESEKRSQSFSTLSAALTNETNNRTEADNQLQTNIDNEIVARTTADVELQNSISTVDAKLGKDENGIYVDL